MSVLLSLLINGAYVFSILVVQSALSWDRFAVLSVRFEVAGWGKEVDGWGNEHRRCEPLGESGGHAPPENFEIQMLGNTISSVFQEVFPLKWQCNVNWAIKPQLIIVVILTESALRRLKRLVPANTLLLLYRSLYYHILSTATFYLWA